MNKKIILAAAFQLFYIFSYSREIKHVKMSAYQKDSIKNEIAQMLKEDQQYRWMLMFGETDNRKLEEMRKWDDPKKYKRISDARKNKVGISLFQKDSIGKIQDHLDSMNFTKLAGVIRKFGFPKECAKIYETTTILLHAPLTMLDSAFFNTLLIEVKAGNLPPIEYATMFDRIQLEKNLPELYYINEHYNDETSKSEISTPLNIDLVNIERRKIGLPAYKKQ